MKRWQSLILTILIGGIISSCSTTKYRVIHKPITLPDTCIFEKFSEAEKISMVESVGRKIFRNQETCRIRQLRIRALIKAHNEAHEES